MGYQTALLWIQYHSENVSRTVHSAPDATDIWSPEGQRLHARLMDVRIAAQEFEESVLDAISSGNRHVSTVQERPRDLIDRAASMAFEAHHRLRLLEREMLSVARSDGRRFGGRDYDAARGRQFGLSDTVSAQWERLSTSDSIHIDYNEGHVSAGEDNQEIPDMSDNSSAALQAAFPKGTGVTPDTAEVLSLPRTVHSEQDAAQGASIPIRPTEVENNGVGTASRVAFATGAGSLTEPVMEGTRGTSLAASASSEDAGIESSTAEELAVRNRVHSDPAVVQEEAIHIPSDRAEFDSVDAASAGEQAALIAPPAGSVPTLPSTTTQQRAVPPAQVTSIPAAAQQSASIRISSSTQTSEPVDILPLDLPTEQPTAMNDGAQRLQRAGEFAQQIADLFQLVGQTVGEVINYAANSDNWPDRANVMPSAALGTVIPSLRQAASSATEVLNRGMRTASNFPRGSVNTPHSPTSRPDTDSSDIAEETDDDARVISEPATPTQWHSQGVSNNFRRIWNHINPTAPPQTTSPEPVLANRASTENQLGSPPASTSAATESR